MKIKPIKAWGLTKKGKILDIFLKGDKGNSLTYWTSKEAIKNKFQVIPVLITPIKTRKKR